MVESVTRGGGVVLWRLQKGLLVLLYSGWCMSVGARDGFCLNNHGCVNGVNGGKVETGYWIWFVHFDQPWSPTRMVVVCADEFLHLRFFRE